MSQHEEFIAAVRAGDADRVTQLLDSDPSLAEAREGNVSAVLLALYHGRADVARLVADRRRSLDFHEACALGDLDRVRAMVGADPSLLYTYSEDGYAPVGFATFFGQDAVDRFLIDAGADVNAQATNAQRVGAVHAAAAQRNQSMMQFLLDHGADPNARQQVDYTPMHTAASRGDVEMARLLLAHGAQRDARGSDGKTPADVAREHEQATFADWISSNEPT
jgi:ankyrin repeat protein